MVTYWDLFEEINKDNDGWHAERNQLKKIHNLISKNEDYNPKEYENVEFIRKSLTDYFEEHEIQISVQYNYLRVLRKYLKLTGKIGIDKFEYYDTWTKELLATRNMNSKTKKKTEIKAPENFISDFKKCVETCNDYALQIIGKYLISGYELNDTLMYKVTLADFVETVINNDSSSERTLDLTTGLWTIYKHGAIIKYKIQLQQNILTAIRKDRLDTNYFIYSKNMIYSESESKDTSMNITYVAKKLIGNSLTQKFKRMYGYSWTDIVSYFVTLIVDRLDNISESSEKEEEIDMSSLYQSEQISMPSNQKDISNDQDKNRESLKKISIVMKPKLIVS